MRLLPRFFFSLLLAGLATASHAQELVSVRTQGINLRSAASTQAEVQWQLARGYPLQVLQREGGWLKVQDFEGDQGWVAASVTQAAPHHVVRVRWPTCAKAPAPNSRWWATPSMAKCWPPNTGAKPGCACAAATASPLG